VGYEIYYGGACGVYTNTVMVGNATTATVGGLSAGATYYFSATTISADGAQSAFSNEAVYVIPADPSGPSGSSPVSNTNQPPTLDAIADVTVNENAGAQSVSLTGISAGAGNANSNVIVSAASSDSTIIPTPTVTYTSPNNTGILNFAPAPNASGTATVTVTVNNEGASNNVESETFTITVTPPPVPAVIPPPTLDSISNVTVYENAGVQTIPLTGISAGTSAGNLIVNVWAYTSDGSIIPAPTVNYTNPSSTGTLTFAPVPNAVGTAIVTVKANNGVANFIQVFTITVVPSVQAGVGMPPSLGAIADVSIPQGTVAEDVTLTGINPGSSATSGSLRISAKSSNPRLLPPPVVHYSGPGGPATLILRPTPAGSGTAVVTVTVTAGGEAARQTFKVTVAADEPPTLAPIGNTTLVEGAGAQTIMLTGITPGVGVGAGALSITAVSSNPRLVFNPGVQYASAANTALLTLTPTGKLTGSAMITVTANNGNRYNGVVHQRFMVTVTPAVGSPAPSVAAMVADRPVVEPTHTVARLETVVRENGQFRFQVNGVAGGRYVVEATSDLNHWTPVATNAAPFTFQAATVEGVSQQFYRAIYVK
jgi:hypothetical protein